MTVLKILGYILAVLSILGLYASIAFYSNKHTQKKFDHSFFSIGAIIVIAIALLFSYFGFEWYKSSLKDGGDTLNGLVLIGIGCIISLCLIVYNWIMTNFVYAFFGSVVQIALLAPIATFGVVILAVLLVLGIIGFFISHIGVQDVRIVK